MPKTKDVLPILDELQNSCKTLTQISEVLWDMLTSPDKEPEKKVEKVQEKQPEKAPETEPEKAEEKMITFEEVRAVLAKKSRAGKENTEAVRELIRRHGVSRLSDIKPEEYPALLKEAEVIPDA